VRELQVRFVHCTISDEPSFSTIERTLPACPSERRRRTSSARSSDGCRSAGLPTARAPNP